jgi:uncharacterized repeat protein (TIGR04076 family)
MIVMTEADCIRNEPWQITCRVIKQQGTCAAGHKVGDEARGKICISALYSMIPKVYAMMHNARFPWLKDQCVATHTCPDGWNPVMFELVRKASD